jgi:hypothetical protein
MSSNYPQPSLEEVLKLFPPIAHAVPDKKAERCPKCKKVYKATSIEGISYKVCGCSKTKGVLV